MEPKTERYERKPAAAWLRGHALRTGTPEIAPELLEMPLEVLSDQELSSILELGERTGQKPSVPPAKSWGWMWRGRFGKPTGRNSFGATPTAGMLSPNRPSAGC